MILMQFGLFGNTPRTVCDGRDMPYAKGRPNQCANSHSRWIRSRVVAKSAGSGEPVFLWVHLIHQSRDTVPLNSYNRLE
jgi:hypothetical protein